jgi:hypothetical protein
MKKSIDLLILKNRARLEKMIADGIDYEKIVKQSQKLDIMIQKKFVAMNSKINSI